MRKKYRQWILKRRLKQAIRLLSKIDKSMKELNWPRWKRKQFWRDFVTSPTFRSQFFSRIGAMYKKDWEVQIEN